MTASLDHPIESQYRKDIDSLVLTILALILHSIICRKTIKESGKPSLDLMYA